jgi:hypothetical protein
LSALRRFAKPIGVGLVFAGLLFGAYLFLVTAPRLGTFGFDAFAYWNVDIREPYSIPVGTIGAFNYAPPIAMVADWFSMVDWTTFVFLWTMLLIGTVVWIAGSPTWILVAFSIPFVALELYHGNINILLAAAIVLGFSHPWTWAFVLLTKPSAGLALLWFVVRGEWRSLFIALGTTAAICAVSFVLMPELWSAWINLLVDSLGIPPTSANIQVPLWIRLPIAAVVVIWGARTDRRWTVVVSAMLAMPVFWFATPAILIGIIPEVRARNEARKREAAAAIERETAETADTADAAEAASA